MNDDSTESESDTAIPGPFQYRFDLDLRAVQHPWNAALWAVVTSYAPFLDDEPDSVTEHDDIDDVFNQLALADLEGDGWTTDAGEAQAARQAFIERAQAAARDGQRLDDDDARTVYAALASWRSRGAVDAWVREAAGADADAAEVDAAATEAARILREIVTINPAPDAVAQAIRGELARGPWGRKANEQLADPHPRVHAGNRRLEAALPWPATLAAAVWHDRHKPRLERSHQRPTTSAPRVVVEALVANPERIAVDDARIITLDGVPTALRITNGMGLRAAQNMVRKTLDQAAFWSVLGWVLETHRNQWLASGSVNDASVVEVAGISELSRAITGYTGKSADDRIRDALRLGQSVEVHAVQGEHAGGLWTWYERKGNRWKPALMRITLGVPLRLDAGSFMPATMKLLAPVANPERTPSLDGFQRRMFGRLRAADQQLMNVLAERTDRAVLDGERLLIPFDRDEDRKRIANDVGLTDRTSARWLERMTEGDAQGVLPPGYSGPVVRLDGHRMIEVAEPGARALLTEQATMRQKASKAGKASARKRRNARNRFK